MDTSTDTATVRDQAAIKRLGERRANRPEQIDNSRLYAGSPMHFYCTMCGHQSDVLPESYVTRPRRQCAECMDLRRINPEFTEQTLIEMADASMKSSR